MKPLNSAVLALAVLPAVALAAPIPETCPTASGCHLPRWVPEGLPADAHFGQAVELEGDRAAIGAPAEGAVYLYEREGGTWSPTQRLENPGGPNSDFGYSLRLDGDELLVGAPRAGVPNGMFELWSGGLVYVYERGESTWELAHTLSFSLPTSGARFGESLDKQGDRIVVGSPGAWYTDEGTIAVFERDGAGWTETAFLNAPDSVGLGSAVALDGPRVLASDHVDDAAGKYAGRVYAWEPDGAGWSDAVAFDAPGVGGGDFFGCSMAADDGWVVVGARGQGLGGSARVYRWDAATQTYVYRSTLTSCDPGFVYWYGREVDLDGDRLVVGSAFETDSGRVHVYRRGPAPAEEWRLELVIGPSDGADEDEFGRHVAVDGAFVLAGASNVDTAVEDGGAAYLVSLQKPALSGGLCPCESVAVVENVGTGKPGSLGLPNLELAAPPVIGEPVVLTMRDALPGAAPVLLWGVVPAELPFDGGALYLADPHPVPMAPVDAAGASVLGWDMPEDPALCGTELVLQALFVDPGAAGAFSTAQTNGLALFPGV